MVEQIVVTDAGAAALAHPTARAILFALMRSEQSLRDLGRELGMSLSLLHYHVGKLKRLGLVQLVRREPRRGRPIAIYGAAARSFLVPAEFDRRVAGSALREELDRALEKARTRDPGAGTLYVLDERHGPRMRRLPGDSADRGTGQWWMRLNLSEADAREFAAAVRMLMARYGNSATGAERPYLCHFALVGTGKAS